MSIIDLQQACARSVISWSNALKPRAVPHGAPKSAAFLRLRQWTDARRALVAEEPTKDQLLRPVEELIEAFRLLPALLEQFLLVFEAQIHRAEASREPETALNGHERPPKAPWEARLEATSSAAASRSSASPRNGSTRP